MENKELQPPAASVTEGNFGSYTLTLESVTPELVTFRRGPPYEDLWGRSYSGSNEKFPDRPTQCYNQESMEMTIKNMRRNRHPALQLFEQAYFQMTSTKS